LVALLRNQFQPADYNDRLFDEIHRRTQGPDESIAMFATVMDNMFDRVTVKVPEATCLKIIQKNLAPYYQNQLGLSLDQLLEAGRVLEARKASVASYVQPMRRKEASSSKTSTSSPFDVRPVKAISGKCWELRQTQSFFSFMRRNQEEVLLLMWCS
jgi:hypothetical protein